MSNRLASIALTALTLYCSAARADETPRPMFSVSGFGTVGAARSGEHQADFTSSAFKPNGTGHTRTWSADVDSLFAAQVTASLTSELSAVLQVISEQNYDNTYRPHVEWGNIKYKFTPDFDVRVGRTVLPAFLLSDTRKVGYTYAWVRPPLEVYGLIPVTHSDGLDASYRMYFGEFSSTLQANAGNSDVRSANGGGTVRARGAVGLSNTIESGPLTARISYHRTLLTIGALNALFDPFRQFGPEGIAIADKYNANSKPLSFATVGASYDPGDWFVTGEWGRVDAKSFVGKRTAWYASGGYRIGAFTPFAAYGQAKADNLSDPGLTVSALPPSLAGPATGLNAALDGLLSEKPVQSTISVGGRWDFIKNAALKMQFDHTRVGAGSTGSLTNLQPGFRLGGKRNVFSASVDFIF